MIYAKDLDGRMTLVNREFERMFHRSRDELIGHTDFDILDRPLAEQLRENDVRVLRGGGPVTYTEVVPRDGESRTWVSVKVPLADADGEVYGLAGVSTDITEQLRASERQAVAAALFEAVSDGILVVDPQLTVIYANSHAAEGLETTAEELVGRRYVDVVPDGSQPQEVDALQAALHGQEVETEWSPRPPTDRPGPGCGAASRCRGGTGRSSVRRSWRAR